MLQHASLHPAEHGWDAGIASVPERLGCISGTALLTTVVMCHPDGLEEDGMSMDDIEAAAKMANAHDFIMAFPRGYRTMVTDK